MKIILIILLTYKPTSRMQMYFFIGQINSYGVMIND